MATTVAMAMELTAIEGLLGPVTESLAMHSLVGTVQDGGALLSGMYVVQSKPAAQQPGHTLLKWYHTGVSDARRLVELFRMC